MKPYRLLLFIAVLFFTKANAQDYNNMVNYNLNGTPVNGIKIVTSLPFLPSAEMPTITIWGYNYSAGAAIGLQIVYYIYPTGTPSTPNFIKASISSTGGYTPQVILANEGGYVVIFINDKPYYPRFTVSAFAKGISTGDNSASYQNWSVVDAPLTGTNQFVLPYLNSFSGTVNMPGTGIWNPTGNVGIGTINPGTYMLAVRGNVHAQLVNVDMNSWSDYVFKKDYALPALDKIKAYIHQNHHLPGIPSEQEVAKDGLNLGQMNKLLLKKVEELTLYLIEKDKAEKEQQKEIDQLKQQLSIITKTLNKN